MLAFTIIILVFGVCPIVLVAHAEWRHPSMRQDQAVPTAPRDYYGMGRRS